MKSIRSMMLVVAAVGGLMTTHAGAADGNTRAPADTPQDRASDRQKPYNVPSAPEGSIGGTPRTSNPREGEIGSGGAQTGNLGASRGGADNAQGRQRAE